MLDKGLVSRIFKELVGHLGGSVKRPILDCGSGHDHRAMRSSLVLGSMFGVESALGSLPAFCLCPSPLLTLSQNK